VGTCCQRLRLINLACNVGDEGGFAPNVTGADESLDLLTEAIKEAGYTGKVQIGRDAASSEFYKEGKYDLDFKVFASRPRCNANGCRTPSPTLPNGSPALSWRTCTTDTSRSMTFAQWRTPSTRTIGRLGRHSISRRKSRTSATICWSRTLLGLRRPSRRRLAMRYFSRWVQTPGPTDY